MQTICKPGDAGYIVPGSKEYCEVIGCSEIATILGFGFEQPKDLWLKKTHRKPQSEHKRIFDRGHDMEPIMARDLRARGRIIVSEQVQYRDPQRPWLIYHADGMFPKWSPLEDGDTPMEGPGPWEGKAPGSRVAGDMKRDGMSSAYVCQTQGGIHVASQALGQDLQWATCGFMDYDEYETVAFDIKRSNSFIAHMLEKLDAFYECLRTDTPPEPINPLHYEMPPEIKGELAIITDGPLISIVERWLRINEVLKSAKDEDALLRDQMKDMLDDVAKAEIPGMCKFSYGYGKPSETIDGAGLLTYCEHLVGQYNELLTCAGEAGLRGGSYITFDRSHWVTPKAPTRSFRPTPVKS
jgi:hypothetical protein